MLKVMKISGWVSVKSVKSMASLLPTEPDLWLKSLFLQNLSPTRSANLVLSITQALRLEPAHVPPYRTSCTRPSGNRQVNAASVRAGSPDPAHTP